MQKKCVCCVLCCVYLSVSSLKRVSCLLPSVLKMKKSEYRSNIMELLARLFLLLQVLCLPFKFCTETANCATAFGLYFKIAPLLINSLSSLQAISQNVLRKACYALHMLCEVIRGEKSGNQWVSWE